MLKRQLSLKCNSRSRVFGEEFKGILFILKRFFIIALNYLRERVSKD